ncbi:MAG: ABC transporter substrate-binding protein, partial [Lachnospiraceae bacterium]|nr:ABC transporter substrate-binding protein [Lachnospiraceae bacterium]
MKKKLLSLIMVGAMVLSMTACGQGGNTGSGNTGSGASGNGALTGTLKLGVIGPLTGGAAIYGNAVANGAKIAVDEINAEATGFTIELQAQDDE